MACCRIRTGLIGMTDETSLYTPSVARVLTTTPNMPLFFGNGGESNPVAGLFRPGLRTIGQCIILWHASGIAPNIAINGANLCIKELRNPLLPSICVSLSTPSMPLFISCAAYSRNTHTCHLFPAIKSSIQRTGNIQQVVF